jgi:imidazole glycerol phosphate synthase subunit HisF
MCTQDERAALIKKIETLDLDSVTKIIEIAKEFDSSDGDELDFADAPQEALWRIQVRVTIDRSIDLSVWLIAL